MRYRGRRAGLAPSSDRAARASRGPGGDGAEPRSERAAQGVGPRRDRGASPRRAGRCARRPGRAEHLEHGRRLRHRRQAAGRGGRDRRRRGARHRSSARHRLPDLVGERQSDYRQVAHRDDGGERSGAHRRRRGASRRPGHRRRMRCLLRAFRASSRSAGRRRAPRRFGGEAPAGARAGHRARRVREAAAMRTLALLVVVLSSFAVAQDYPTKPVRMVVGFPPGGGTDVVARILAPRLSELLAQALVIDNRPGATGTVAAGHLAKSLPDGYTLMMGHVSVNAIAPSLFANLPYDVERDFAPIGLAAAAPHLVVVHPSVPVTTLRELIAYLKAQPGQFTFPSAGTGSMPHLAGEIFQRLAGVRLVHVPYKGTGQSMQDLLGGQHIVAFDTMAASGPHARSGKLRAVAVSTAQRVGSFPDVPTAEEAGLPGYVVTTWYGVFAPAGTPASIVNRLHAELVKAMQTPDVRTKLEGIGADGSVSRTPHEFAQLVRADSARYAKIVKDIGLKIE